MAHHLRSNGEKMSPILPPRIAARQEGEKRFLHEGGRLDGVVLPFPAQVSPGEPMQFRADQRPKFVERRTVAPTPNHQQPRDLACLSLHSSTRPSDERIAQHFLERWGLRRGNAASIDGGKKRTEALLIS